MSDKLGFMRRLNLFEQMVESEVEQISKELKMRHCRAHEAVFEGSPERVYLLKAGRVRLYHLSPDGDEVTTAWLANGSTAGWRGSSWICRAQPRNCRKVSCFPR